MKINYSHIILLIIIIALVPPTLERLKHRKRRAPAPILEYSVNFGAVATNKAKSQFFDPAHIKVIYNGAPDEESFDTFIQKINADVPTANKLVLSSDNDLTIKKIGIYKRPFALMFVHELLSICVSNSASPEKFYNFIFHRGSKDGMTDLSTAVRITYYDTTSGENDCKPAHTIDPNSKLRKKKGVSLETTEVKIKSLKVLFEMARQYAITYPEYKAAKQNCQHFASGFYNAVIDGPEIGTANLKSKAPQYKNFKELINKLLEDYNDSRADLVDDEDVESTTCLIVPKAFDVKKPEKKK